MNFVRFTEALTYDTDEGRQYDELGPIYINPDLLAGFYNHTLLISDHKIRVMEDLDHIKAKLLTGG